MTGAARKSGWTGGKAAVLAAAFWTVLSAGGAFAQMQAIPTPKPGEDPGVQERASPFLGSNPPSLRSQGGQSYYQYKQANPAAPVRCDAFNRIGQSYDECRARELNQAWQKQQNQQAGNPPANPRLQPVDPLANTRPYR